MKEYFRQPIVDTLDTRICTAKSVRHVVIRVGTIQLLELSDLLWLLSADRSALGLPLRS